MVVAESPPSPPSPTTAAASRVVLSAQRFSRLRTNRVHNKPFDGQRHPRTRRMLDYKNQQKVQALAVIKRYINSFHERRRRRQQKASAPPRRRVSNHWAKVQSLHTALVQLSLAHYRVKAQLLSEEEFIALDKGGAFWAQADPDMHLKEVWVKRMALRKHPVVVKELNNYNKLFQPPVKREQHRDLFLAFYKVLIDPWDEADALECAHEDWIEDASTGEAAKAAGLVPITIAERPFMDAVFQLADHWTHSVDPREYAKFLRLVFDLITTPSGAEYRLKPLDQITYIDIEQLMSAPTLSEQRAARQAKYEEELTRLRKLFAKPKIPVHMTSKPLLVSRDHFGSPRTGAWGAVAAMLSPLPAPPQEPPAQQPQQPQQRPTTSNNSTSTSSSAQSPWSPTAFRPDRRLPIAMVRNSPAARVLPFTSPSRT